MTTTKTFEVSLAIGLTVRGVTATCEECGQASEFPASQMGTTQDCPRCGRYMDVPDPDENWDFDPADAEPDPDAP